MNYKCQFCGKILEDFVLCDCEQAVAFRNANKNANFNTHKTSTTDGTNPFKKTAPPPPPFPNQKKAAPPPPAWNTNTTGESNDNKNNEQTVIEWKGGLQKFINLMSKIYIFDFFRRLIKKNNMGTIIFLILNIGLYIVLLTGGFRLPEMIPTAIVLYLLSLIIALSPIGELMVRLQSGCKSIKKFKKKYDVERLEALFKEVYDKARQKDPAISGKVKLFISKESSPNAFATGRRTVCVTLGLLELDDNQIKGILGHEFGHIAHKDTDLLLVIIVSNMLLSILFAVYRILVTVVVYLIGEGERSLGGLGNLIARILIDIILVACIRLWTKIGVLLVMHSSRQNEFEADKYSCELGYGNELANALSYLNGNNDKKSFWYNLRSSHPDMGVRIEKIKNWITEHGYQRNTYTNQNQNWNSNWNNGNPMPMGSAAAYTPPYRC